MITLFGASGYTGRLVARELASLEPAPGFIRLAGRSHEKLTELASTLPYQTEVVVADARRPASLPALFDGTRVLINCAGPFTDLGETLVAMAAMHGCHYVDTTNELGFVHRMKSYHQLAAANRAAIIPGCGFEVAVADCAAALMAKNFSGPLTTVDVIYALSGGNSSLGTRKSAIRTLGTSWLAYRNSDWIQAVPCSQTRWVSLPQGKRSAISIPSSEIATLPTHLKTGRIDTWLIISRRSRLWARAVLPMFAWLARSPLAGIMAEISARLTPPPKTGLRSEDRWLIQLELSSSTQNQTATLSGKGVYDITAKIAAYAAGQLLFEEPTQFGVLAPSAVLDARKFLEHAAEHWGCLIDSVF